MESFSFKKLLMQQSGPMEIWLALNFQASIQESMFLRSVHEKKGHIYECNIYDRYNCVDKMKRITYVFHILCVAVMTGKNQMFIKFVLTKF